MATGRLPMFLQMAPYQCIYWYIGLSGLIKKKEKEFILGEGRIGEELEESSKSKMCVCV